MISLDILLELAKISPYLIIPIIFAWILWKINEKHIEFVNQVMLDKNQHYTELITNIEKLSVAFTDKLGSFEREYREKQESHNDNISSRISELASKIDSLRLELAWGEKKK